ncbi:MAG TPA: SH3 domain-containing protein, partial [Candidatus Wallbacteria bacterium]|nr:SH3 domain-containing protein [Candidatus Wallbacteria bacterium]
MNYLSAYYYSLKKSSLLLVLAALIIATATNGIAGAEGVSGVQDSLKAGRIVTDATGAASGTINVSEDSYLNVRTGPGTNYNIIGQLHRYDNIKVLDEKLGWYKINYNGSDAWINGYYVSGVQTNSSIEVAVYGTVATSDGESVSLRIGAGLDNTAVDALPNGARFKVLD